MSREHWSGRAKLLGEKRCKLHLEGCRRPRKDVTKPWRYDGGGHVGISGATGRVYSGICGEQAEEAPEKQTEKLKTKQNRK